MSRRRQVYPLLLTLYDNQNFKKLFHAFLFKNKDGVVRKTSIFTSFVLQTIRTLWHQLVTYDKTPIDVCQNALTPSFLCRRGDPGPKCKVMCEAPNNSIGDLRNLVQQLFSWGRENTIVLLLKNLCLLASNTSKTINLS